MTIKKYYIKFGENEYELHGFTHKKQNNSTIDTTELSLSRNHNSIFDIGDDVSIGYYNAGDSFVAEFNGDITSKQVNEELVMTMESYDGRIYRTEYVTAIYEDEAIEDIVDDLITTYTDLTYASSIATGLTLERFVINTETVGEVLTRILKKLDWQIRTDNDANFYFEPSGSIAASVILTNGSNAFLQGEWVKNPNRLINSCVVRGDKAKFNTNETEVASASQTDFIVTYKITGNVRVTVDGTEKLGGQPGGTGTYDYSIDKEQKTIIFESGLTGGESVVVYYEYELPIKISATNEESISLYGTFPKKITDNTLKTTSDARKLARSIVSIYGSPVTSGKLRVSWDENVDIGQTVQVIDSFNSINQTFIVVNMEKNYPDGNKIISVGVEEFNSLDMNKDINDRIKRLEAEQDNSDVIQKYLSIKNNIDIVVKQGRIRTRTKSISGDTMIWNNADFGTWNTHKWGAIGQESFILGSAAAELGTNKLGNRSSEWVVNFVSSYNNIMNERFNFDTYKDTTNTTATWNTTGEKVTFTSGQIAQSLGVAVNDGTITDATLTATETSGDFDYGMKVTDSSATPVAQWRFNDTLTDSVGSNDGTFKMTDAVDAYYPFNGNANDESNSSNNGSVTGASLTTDRFDNADSAYEFDGSANDLIDFGTSITIGANGTYNIWIKGDIADQIAENIYPFGVQGKHVLLGPAGGTTPRFGLLTDDGTNHYYTWGNQGLYDGEWHMYTVSWDATNVYAWLDGQSVGAAKPHSGEIWAGTGITLAAGGGWSSTYGHHTGKLDEMMVLDKTLKDNEVLDLYNLTNVRDFNGSPYVTGKLGNALEVNQLNYLELDSELTMNYQSSSICFWAYITDNIKEDGASIVSATLNSSGTEHIFVCSASGGSDNLFYMEPTTNGVDVSWNGKSTLTNGWHHFAFTMDIGGVPKLYLDRVDQGLPDSTAQTVTDSWNINYIGGTTGYDSNYGDYVNTRIDDMRIFETTITSEDVGAIYNSGTGNEFSDAYFEPVTSGTAHTFTNSGTDLRWIAAENAGSTGEITKIKIENYKS